MIRHIKGYVFTYKYLDSFFTKCRKHTMSYKVYHKYAITLSTHIQNISSYRIMTKIYLIIVKCRHFFLQINCHFYKNYEV